MRGTRGSNRDVAVKTLLEALAADAERIARFQRAAKTLASLNHPNIAQIHGLEESRGVRALVMELVEGEDLWQRIARGALPLDEAMPIARQIGEALEAPHQQGGYSSRPETGQHQGARRRDRESVGLRFSEARATGG